MNKKKLERLKREIAKREAKERSESEDRQEKIRVLWQEIKESPDAAKELAKDPLGQTLLDLVLLQKHEMDYLRPFSQLVQEISKRFPREWQDLSLANAVAGLHEFYPWLEKHCPGVLPVQAKLSPKQKQEAKRRRLSAAGGVGLIEREFGDAKKAELRNRWMLLSPAFCELLAPSPTCLDDIFAGGGVNMWRLQELFGMERHRIGKILPSFKKGRERLYDYRAVVTIMDRLLSEKP